MTNRLRFQSTGNCRRRYPYWLWFVPTRTLHVLEMQRSESSYRPSRRGGVTIRIYTARGVDTMKINVADRRSGEVVDRDAPSDGEAWESMRGTV